MRTALTLAILTTLLGAFSNAASAQTTTSAAFRAGAGVGADGGVFGDDDPKSERRPGLTLGVQARAGVARRTGFVFETAWQPIGIANPHFDETLTTLYLQAGPEIGRLTYVRPTFGVGLQSWSGSRSCRCLELAPAAGLAVGRQFQITPTVSIRPEFYSRAAMTVGAVGWQMGVQVPVGWSK